MKLQVISTAMRKGHFAECSVQQEFQSTIAAQSAWSALSWSHLWVASTSPLLDSRQAAQYWDLPNCVEKSA